MATKKVKNMRLYIEDSDVVASNLDIDSHDIMNKTVVLADDDDETPRNVDLVATDKFRTKSFGDWELGVFINYIKDFESREEFDDWCISKELRVFEEEYQVERIKSAEKISFEDILVEIGVEFSLNKNYYLEHQDEIEHDLNRKLTNSENLTDKFPEKELLYKQLCKLFGENSLTNDDYDYILEDFHFLDNTGNSRAATAKQGQYYLKFLYYSS